MRKLQEFEMFKRLILDKEQEKLFRSLPKPNLVNLDIVEEEEENQDEEYELREENIKRVTLEKMKSNFTKNVSRSKTSIESIKEETDDNLKRRKTKIEVQIESEKAYSDLKIGMMMI